MKGVILKGFDFFDSCFLHYLCLTRGISNHLGYIEISDIGKELYEAIRNDFPEAPSIDSIRKICPQNEWVINENKSRYKYKIEEIKRLL